MENSVKSSLNFIQTISTILTYDQSLSRLLSCDKIKKTCAALLLQLGACEIMEPEGTHSRVLKMLDGVYVRPLSFLISGLGNLE